METDLVCLVYTSRLDEGQCSEDDIHAIIEKSIANNRKRAISGMLLYSDGVFLQALEGPKAAVKETFERIKADQRHDAINKLSVESIGKRQFPDWSMGFASLTRSELTRMPGAKDLLTASQSLFDVGPGTAKHLLEAFLSRNWHDRVR